MQSDAVTFLSTYKVGESYQCWYNPAAPNIVRAATAEDIVRVEVTLFVGFVSEWLRLLHDYDHRWRRHW